MPAIPLGRRTQSSTGCGRCDRERERMPAVAQAGRLCHRMARGGGAAPALGSRPDRTGSRVGAPSGERWCGDADRVAPVGGGFRDTRCRPPRA
ncbi:hypothetical protein FRACA_1610002 [Frankia canadensis]|uniref:Uncharacterized protein n=1 Tax=Frankia canadensis TaxID=1836972 RepID=A0A2I2KMN5_9ACTN|nr:hypothetical protein FRACA_1610002 [Frankia canadensis]SOU54213.1 hypothetical protein FRACA_1610002 [Frankia canadensis]